MQRTSSHSICTDHPHGDIALWVRASVRAAGHGCDVVSFEAAVQWLDAQLVDGQRVDCDGIDIGNDGTIVIKARACLGK